MRYVMYTLLLLAVIVPTAAFAQDDMMEDKIVCDSTVITLLYLAEADYSYSPMMDVSQFDKGQYADAFEAMMMAMDDDMMEEDMSDGDMMEEDMSDGEMMEDDMMMTTLVPGDVAGEDPACTELRASLDSFFAEVLTGEMMMDDM